MIPPLRIGLLGASSIAPSAVVEPALRRDDVEVVAVAARRPGAASSFAGRWGIPRVAESYEALIGDPRLDVIYVSLAASDHARWSIAALESGKHVLVEKPAATTAAEARAMVGAARRNDRVLLEAFHYRHHPLFADLVVTVKRGESGQLTRMAGSILGSRPFEPGSVLHDPALGGGALWHSGCYALHFMRTLTGHEPVVVSASRHANPAGADSSSNVQLLFPGEVSGTIASSFERNAVAADPPQLQIDFERGRLQVDGFISPHAGHSIREWRDGRLIAQRTVAGATSYDYQLGALIHSIRVGDDANRDAEDLISEAVALESAYVAMG